MSDLTERMKRNAEQLDAIADVMRDSDAKAVRVEAVATMLKSMRCLTQAADEIDRLTRELAEAREAIRRYGDRMRMSFAPPEWQQVLDDAFAASALKEKP